jgi:Beta-glucanase/Beta-glucan synthetase
MGLTQKAGARSPEAHPTGTITCLISILSTKVSDGNLILRGINNYTLPNDTAPYLTGGLYTKDKVTFTYGKVEIRAKLQGAKGAWPAFWMLPKMVNGLLVAR